MTLYTEILDPKNPTKPKDKNIAMQLEQCIDAFERQNSVKLISACFLGKSDVLKDGEDGAYIRAVAHDRVHKYMLFFN